MFTDSQGSDKSTEETTDRKVEGKNSRPVPIFVVNGSRAETTSGLRSASPMTGRRVKEAAERFTATAAAASGTASTVDKKQQRTPLTAAYRFKNSTTTC